MEPQYWGLQHPAPTSTPPVHNPIPWMMTGLAQSGWQSAPPYQQQQVFPPTTLQPQAVIQPSISVLNQQQVNQPVPLQQSTSNPTQPA